MWHTYPPVPVPDARATAAALARSETWPDYACELGRFTPVRPGALDGQTFEIEVVGHPTSRTPMWLRLRDGHPPSRTGSAPSGTAGGAAGTWDRCLKRRHL